MKVLEALAAAIAAEGIDHIFAVMGDANQDVIVELCEKHRLKYVHAHHEGSAVGMADGLRAFLAKSALLPPRKALAIPTQRLPWLWLGCIDRRY
jgi:acetolactate synthase I/II/III large subunit